MNMLPITVRELLACIAAGLASGDIDESSLVSVDYDDRVNDLALGCGIVKRSNTRLQLVISVDSAEVR